MHECKWLPTEIRGQPSLAALLVFVYQLALSWIVDGKISGASAAIR